MSPSANDRSEAELLRAIDRLCDAFEAGWRDGNPQAIERYLSRVSPPHQEQLLRELLPLDADYRRLAGQTPDPTDYIGRGLHADEGVVREIASQACRRDSLLPESRLGERSATQRPPGEAPRRNVSCRDVLRRMQESTLVSDGDLTAIDDALRQSGNSAAVDALRSEVLRRGLLTAYQIDELITAVDAQLTVGRYVLLDRIGRGGMGTVYKAVHRDMDRVVALKVLSRGPHLGAEALARFHREIRVAASLSHPNIVIAFDAGAHRGRPYLAMEFIEGENLEQRVRRLGAMPPPESLHWMLQAARALEHAHARGVIHRDVKPANLMATADGVLKLLDLGLSTASRGGEETASRLTRSTMIMGTPEFMAPEQASDLKHADHRADIYSLGRTWAFLLAGQHASTRLQWKDEPGPPAVPPPARLPSHTPATWESVVSKMTANDPRDRYQNMGEIIAALETLQHPPAPQPAALPALSVRRDTHRSPGRRSPTGWSLWWVAAVGGLLAVAIWAATLPTGAGVASRPAADDAASKNASPSADATRDAAGAPTRQASPKQYDASPAPQLRAPSRDEAKAYQKQWASALRQPVARHAPDLDVEFRLIPPGEFDMGIDTDEALVLTRRLANVDSGIVVRSEAPQHRVRITRAFYLGAGEITIAQFRKFVAATDYRTTAEIAGRAWGRKDTQWRVAPGHSWKSLGDQPMDDLLPAVNLSWQDARAYCRWASRRIGGRVRLPTEAEWEYACRAGSTTMWPFGDNGRMLRDYAWVGANSMRRLHRSRTVQPNAFGLYDMIGNAHEWCSDLFQAQYYRDSPLENPKGPTIGRGHVLRGGAANSHPAASRSTSRLAGHNVNHSLTGFRIVLELKTDADPAPE